MECRRDIALTVNGETVRREVAVRQTLVDFLRQELGLTGSHVGCEHGVCGACSLRLDGRVVRGCLTLAVQADGARIEIIADHTVEPLTNTAMLEPPGSVAGGATSATSSITTGPSTASTRSAKPAVGAITVCALAPGGSSGASGHAPELSLIGTSITTCSFLGARIQKKGSA